MLAEQSLREGNLQEALAQLQDQVRKAPSDARLRVFLFQLLAVLGDWNRSLNQLNVAGELDDATLAMVQTYREAIRCEVLRGRVFAGERSPVVFGEPEAWIARLIEAVRVGAEGRQAEAQALRDEAFEAAPASGGTILTAAAEREDAEAAGRDPDVPPPGAAFEWIADADGRLGPILEAVVNGRYYWIPFDRIKTVHFDAPADLRDLVWTAAHFTWANGGEAVGLVPTRYPGSEASEDGAIRLARRTEWVEVAADLHHGLGQRMLATDLGEHPLLEVRRIAIAGGGAPGTEG